MAGLSVQSHEVVLYMIVSGFASIDVCGRRSMTEQRMHQYLKPNSTLHQYSGIYNDPFYS